MTTRYRRIYNDYELTLLAKKLNDVIDEQIESFVEQFDSDDIIYGNAFKATHLFHDLLQTELENGIELSQVGGLKPFEALILVTEGITTLSLAMQYDETFGLLSKDK